MPGSEAIIEVRGTRDNVRPTGQTGQEVVSETGIRAAISSVVQDLIPNYFVTNLAGFIGAYADIRANYPGGNIYITGDIIMVDDISLDLRSINITGMGANWRFYNGSDLNPARVYFLEITDGSPIFEGINFWGTNGASGLLMQNGTTRRCFKINPSNPSISKFITFRDCIFSDIVGGTPQEVMQITGAMATNAGLNLNFEGCKVASHGTRMALTGFRILYSSSANSGLISVNIRNQRPSQEWHDSLYYQINSANSNVVNFTFNSDETAWIDSNSSLSIITRTNSIQQALPHGASVDTSNTYVLVSAISGPNNITRLTLAQLNSAGGGLTSIGLNMPTSMFNVVGSPLLSNGNIGVELRVQPNSTVLIAPIGASGVPTFRRLDAVDIPALPYDKYDYFVGGISGSTQLIRGVNWSAGSSCKGLSFLAGANVSISQSMDAEGALRLTINAAAPGVGTVTSVGLAAPTTLFNSVTGTPVTGNGTLGLSLKTQPKGTVFASDGAAPFFRSLVSSDIPNLSLLYDNYKSFKAGTPGQMRDIIGSNGAYILGTNYKGITFVGGNGIDVSAGSGEDGTLTIDITNNATVPIDNTIEQLALTTDKAVPGSMWTGVLQMSLRAAGKYSISATIVCTKSSTTLSTIAARISVGGVVIGSVEMIAALNSNSQTLSITGIHNQAFASGRDVYVNLEFYSDLPGWISRANTLLTNQPLATKMAITKIT